MGFDFGKLETSAKGASYDPVKLYAARPGVRWDRLRAEQKEVLTGWFKRRDERDLVVKQNTGSGKTLTGLLIGMSCLKEKKGPVVYLVPGRHLIDQVVEEANFAKIPVATDINDISFRASKSILVVTFQKLINGRSSFNHLDGGQWLPLGAVIVDDAHAALSAAEGAFTAVVRSETSAFHKLIDLFQAEIRAQSKKAFRDIVDNDSSAPVRISPRFIKESVDEIIEIVTPDVRIENPELFFSWNFVVDNLAVCSFTVTNSSIEIMAPCPSISTIPSFSEAGRRIYLSATLQDESDLITELDADPDSVKLPITPDSASDLGDRMILAPAAINPSIGEKEIRQAVSAVAKGNPNTGVPGKNVVVLVPSWKIAKFWKSYANYTLTVDNMQEVVSRMQGGEHLGLVVLINKYDGVDLPGDACRLLVIDGLPSSLSPAKRRMAAALSGSSEYKALQAQKLEQGMGRGVRDVSDFAAVIVLQAEPSLLIYNESIRDYFSPGTRAQLNLSQSLADQDGQASLDSIMSLVDRFLDRDQNWVQASKNAIASAEYGEIGHVSDLARARRSSFNRFLEGSIEEAISILEMAVENVDDEKVRGWYMEELATYYAQVDGEESERVLFRARKLNRGVVKSQIVMDPVQLVIDLPQPANCSTYLAENFESPVEIQLKFREVVEGIAKAWGVPGTSEKVEEYIRELGVLLGFDSSRPELERGDGGPDNLWVAPGGISMVIEAKNEVRRGDRLISKSEVEQLTHSLSWFANCHPQLPDPLPVLFHPFREANRDVQLPRGTTVVDGTIWNSIFGRVVDFSSELARMGAWSDAAVVGGLLARHELQGTSIFMGGKRRTCK